MNKKSVQSALLLIKKYAQDTEFDAPGASKPAAKPIGKPVVTQTAPINPADPGEITAPGSTVHNVSTKKTVQSSSVKEMQLAIIKLANTISASIDYDALQQAMSRQPGTPESPRKTELMSDYNTDRFSDFIVTTYLRGSDIKGSEYDTDPKKTKVEDKNPSDLKNMFSILDSLKRIGSGKSEFQPDSMWGPRTNNALKNVRAISDGIMKLGSDLGMKSDVFNANKLAELSSLIPEKDTDINYAEKESRAKQITQLLNGANALYLDYKNQVLTKPAYRRFFEGAPLLEVGPAKSNFVGDEETIFKNIKNYTAPKYVFNIELGKIQPSLLDRSKGQTFTKSEMAQISAADLVDKNTFESWAKNNSYLNEIIRNDPEKWNKLIPSILSQIKQLAEGYTQRVNA